MGQAHARLISRRGIAVERKGIAAHQRDMRVCKLAHAQFGALQIGQNADRAMMLLLNRADGFDALAQKLVAGMAHVDAKHIGAGEKQLLDDGRVLRRRPKSGEDFYTAVASHLAVSFLL